MQLTVHTFAPMNNSHKTAEIVSVITKSQDCDATNLGIQD